MARGMQRDDCGVFWRTFGGPRAVLDGLAHFWAVVHGNASNKSGTRIHPAYHIQPRLTWGDGNGSGPPVSAQLSPVLMPPIATEFSLGGVKHEEHL